MPWALALVVAGPATAEDFAWRGRVGAGQTLEIRGVNGGITADASGGEVEVTAVKRGRNSDPASVEVKVVEHGGGVTICAVYPSRGRTPEHLRARRRAQQHQQQRRAGRVLGEGTRRA